MNSLFVSNRMTEQSLRVSATLKYGRHIEFVNLNPGLLQMSSFHMQKHGRCNYPLGVTPVTTTVTAVQNSIENPVQSYQLTDISADVLTNTQPIQNQHSTNTWLIILFPRGCTPFWSAPRIATSGQVQFSEHVQRIHHFANDQFLLNCG